MYKTGLIIGKFYPFHLGHKHLIDVAQSKVRDLYIIVSWSRKETIPGEVRYSWVKNAFPNARVLMVEDKDYDKMIPSFGQS
jgi:cytidyltransferase-like protein